MTHETLRKAWDADRAVFGGWVVGGEEFSLNVYRRAGYDYVGMDCQHSSISEAAAARIIQRSPADAPPTFVRVSCNDAALIGRVADAGADGVIVPMVSSAAEAAAAAAAVRYPPSGVRSFGPSRPDLPAHDLEALSARISVFVMIETARGLAEVDQIVSVPGVTGVYIGPADLSIALGMSPLSAFTTDQLLEPVDTIRRACDRAGTVLGMHQLSARSARDWVERGVRLVTVGSDSGMLLGAAQAALHEVRSEQPRSGTEPISPADR